MLVAYNKILSNQGPGKNIQKINSTNCSWDDRY